LLQHITSKNTSNVFTYNIDKSWLKHEADRCNFFSNMFWILRIHHQGVKLCVVEVADVFIRGNCANCAKAGSGSDLSCGLVWFARTGGMWTDTRKPATNPHTTGSCKLNRTT
jgi:hypothetical protein